MKDACQHRMANLYHSREQQSGRPMGFCTLPSAWQSMCCVDQYVLFYVWVDRSCSVSLFQWDTGVGLGFLILHAFKALTTGESQIFLPLLCNSNQFLACFFSFYSLSFCFSQGKKCWLWWEGLFAEYFQGQFTEAATFSGHAFFLMQ